MQHLDDGTLQGWLDESRSGLSAAELAAAEEHLASCEPCARRLAELDALSGRIETLLSEPGPADETAPPYAEVIARAGRSDLPDREHRGRPENRAHEVARRARKRWRAAAWAASVVVAVGIGWLANGLHRPTDAEAERAVAEDAGSDTSAATPSVAVAKAGPDTLTTLVHGRVTDESGRPLAGAQVSVQGTAVGALTNRDGAFELSLEPNAGDSTAREVTLKAQMIGYAEVSHTLAARDGGNVSTDFRLTEQPLALEGLVVTSVGDTTGRNRSLGASAGTISASSRSAWRGVSAAVAQDEAGFRPLTVPDLRVLRVEVGRDEGAVLVRVVQELDDGGSLELVESRTARSPDQHLASRARAHASVRRGDVWVAAAAPVSGDSLTALLGRLR